MFKELLAFLENASLNMVISKNGEKIIVSTIPKLKGEDQPEIKPLIISGTAEELDAGFIEAIQKKMAPVAGLTIEAEAFDASVDEAKEELDKENKKKKSKNSGKSSSKTPAKKEEKEKPAPKVKEKSAKEWVKEGTELMAAKKYSEAVLAYEAALKLTPDDKKTKDLYEAAKRWEKQVKDLYKDEDQQGPEPKTETKMVFGVNSTEYKDPNQTNLIDEAAKAEEKQEEKHEGPEEGREDNAIDEEEELNFG